MDYKENFKKLDSTFQDTVKNVLRNKEGSFICWKEKTGENHCFYGSCSIDDFVDMLAHLIACRAQVSPPFKESLPEIFSKLKDKLNV